MDAGNMLKPMLARGELHCIGATTLDEYRKHIEKDAALERRFQPVMVEEPTRRGHDLDPARPARALRGPPRRAHPGRRARRRGDASHRYITDRFLPDKAIDLVDEACAVIRTEIDSMPQELDEITRRVMQLEIEEAALTKENDAASKERLEALRKELADLRAQADAMTAQWEAERAGDPQGCRRCARSSSSVRHEIEEAERDYDLNRAAELRHGRLPELERRLRPRRSGSRAKQGGAAPAARGGHRGGDRRGRRPLDRHPGRPPMEGEREKLLRLDEVLHERVVGQDEAVQLVADAVIRARAGHQGPAPADRLVHLPRADRGRARPSSPARSRRRSSTPRTTSSASTCREYQERHTVSRLVGAPPGYVGYEEGGQLTEAVRRKPYSVVLFDEIEKAHPDVFNMLLQVLDDGRLTDAQGRTVDFRNTVVIMTSNIGSLLPAGGRRPPSGEIPEEARGRGDGRAARALPARVPQPRRRHRAVQAADARRDRADRRAADRRPPRGASPTGASSWS